MRICHVSKWFGQMFGNGFGFGIKDKHERREVLTLSL